MSLTLTYVMQSFLLSYLIIIQCSHIYTKQSHLCTVQFSLSSLHSAVLSPNFTQCSSLSQLYTVQLSPNFTQCSSLSQLYTVQFSLPALHSAVFSPSFTQCISLSQPDTVQFSLQSLYCADLYSVVLSPKFTQCSSLSHLYSAVPVTQCSSLSESFTQCSSLSHLYMVQSSEYNAAWLHSSVLSQLTHCSLYLYTMHTLPLHNAHSTFGFTQSTPPPPPPHPHCSHNAISLPPLHRAMSIVYTVQFSLLS